MKNSSSNLILGTVLFACGIGLTLSALVLTTTTLQDMLEGSSVSFAINIVLGGLGIASLLLGSQIISEVLSSGLYLEENQKEGKENK